MNNRFVLFGNGIHAQRYYEALIFSGEDYDIQYGDVSKTVIKASDSVIITEPFFLETNCNLKLNNASTIYLEKLPFHTIRPLKDLVKNKPSSKIIVNHTRLWEPVYIVNWIGLPGHNHLVWPNLYHTDMNPIWHTLPNIIDWFVRQAQCSITQIHPQSAIRMNDCFKIIVEVKTIVCEIDIVDAGTTDRVIFNNTSVNWPNYIETYCDAILLSDLPIDSVLEYEEKTIMLINTIEEMMGYEY